MKSQFLRLVKFVSPYKGTLLLAMSLMLGESALSLASPWLAGQFTESLLSESDHINYSYRQILLLWLVVLVVQGLLTFGNRYLLGNTGETILSQLRVRIYDHLQALPLDYFHNRKRGEVLTILTNDADIISDFVIVVGWQCSVRIGSAGLRPISQSAAVRHVVDQACQWFG